MSLEKSGKNNEKKKKLPPSKHHSAEISNAHELNGDKCHCLCNTSRGLSLSRVKEEGTRENQESRAFHSLSQSRDFFLFQLLCKGL